MTREVSFLAEAYDDLEAAVAWYNDQEPGRGAHLTAAVRDMVSRVAEQPRLFSTLSGPYRRAVVKRFPYLLVFRDTDDQVVIAAVWHGKRSRRALLERIGE